MDSVECREETRQEGTQDDVSLSFSLRSGTGSFGVVLDEGNRETEEEGRERGKGRRDTGGTECG